MLISCKIPESSSFQSIEIFQKIPSVSQFDAMLFCFALQFCCVIKKKKTKKQLILVFSNELEKYTLTMLRMKRAGTQTIEGDDDITSERRQT